MKDYDYNSPAPWENLYPKKLFIDCGVTRIGNYAFSSCYGVSNQLIIPDSVKEIGDYAFCTCLNLSGQLILGKNVRRIGKFAFNDCNNLTGPLTIPGSVTRIGIRAFAMCSGLTDRISIPDSVSIIEDGAFSECGGNRFSVASGNAHFCEVKGVLYNSDKTDLISCPTGKSEPFDKLNVPDTVTKICDCAFCSCNDLTG